VISSSGDQLDYCTLVYTGDDRLRDKEVADFRKSGLAPGNNTGMGDQLDELLDAVPLLWRLNEYIAPQLVGGNDGRHPDIRCPGGGLDRKDTVDKDLGCSRNLGRCRRRGNWLCHNHRN